MPFLLSLLFFFIVACDKGSSLYHIKGKTMGTTYNVKVSTAKEFNEKLMKEKIDEILIRVNNQMSTYQKNSEISLFNQFKENSFFKVSPDFFKVAKFSLSLAHMTDGHYDPTIGPLVNLWGFGPDGKRKVPSDAKIAEVKKLVGHTKMKINEKDFSLFKSTKDLYLDLSSSAKGFGVDKIMEFIKTSGYESAMVEIGGELKVSGLKAGKNLWTLAIESPENGGEQKIVQLKNIAMATSGNYRNFFKEGGKRYGHTISHVTGKPVETRLASVTILSKEGCMQADALATAFMSMGLDKSLKYAKKHQIAAFFIYKEGDKLVSSNTALFNSYTLKGI